jgi:hypothetical protein
MRTNSSDKRPSVERIAKEEKSMQRTVLRQAPSIYGPHMIMLTVRDRKKNVGNDLIRLREQYEDQVDDDGPESTVNSKSS